jgi:hypothetical protein
LTDDETIVLRVTVIGGKRHPDDYQVIWRKLPIGRIMKRDGVPPSQAEQWWWGFTFYGKPSLSNYNGGCTDLEDCIAKFKAAWTRIRADLTDADIAKAHEMRR